MLRVVVEWCDTTMTTANIPVSHAVAQTRFPLILFFFAVYKKRWPLHAYGPFPASVKFTEKNTESKSAAHILSPF